jgi:hypothetical protein
MARYTETQRNESIKALRALLKPGSRVYTILRHCSASGMTRAISLVTIRKGEPYNLTWHVARALGMPLVDVAGHRAIKIQGAGMDMGFDLVYSTGRILWPNGGPMAKSSPTRQHQAKGDVARALYPDAPAKGAKRETDGGYLLRHDWL